MLYITHLIKNILEDCRTNKNILEVFRMIWNILQKTFRIFYWSFIRPFYRNLRGNINFDFLPYFLFPDFLRMPSLFFSFGKLSFSQIFLVNNTFFGSHFSKNVIQFNNFNRNLSFIARQHQHFMSYGSYDILSTQLVNQFYIKKLADAVF